MKNNNTILARNKNNLDKCERIIPDSIFKYIKQNKIKVEVLGTGSKWYGVTYKEDRPMIVNAIKEMLENNEYPNNLWD